MASVNTKVHSVLSVQTKAIQTFQGLFGPAYCRTLIVKNEDGTTFEIDLFGATEDALQIKEIVLMQDQITELAAQLAKATTEAETRAVDLAIYHTREALEQQHRRTRDGILTSLAELMTAHEDDRARLRKLEGQASEKVVTVAGVVDRVAAA